jgi:putative nucleotidyltransferase with HDIG domain
MTAAQDPLQLDRAIVDLVSRGAVKVPPYPAVAMRVGQLVRRHDYGLDEVAKLVASDQSLAADALRCANSSFYARGVPVSSLQQAVSRIGAQEVARLAIASGLGGHARAPGPLAGLKRRVWLEALATAGLCQELAKRRGLGAEEAFVCGLLHDFGKVIAIACIEEILAARAEHARPLPLEYWLGVVERYHVELGLVLAARWELPPLVSDVISLHHSDDVRAAADPKLVALVKAMDHVVLLLDGRSWIEPHDLAPVTGLAAAERDVVVRVIDRLPGFIASFEGAGDLPHDEASLVAPGEAPLVGPVPMDCAARIVVSRRELSYRASGIAAANLLVRGPAPVPENLLLAVHLDVKPELRFWATAKLSWPEAGGQTVLLQPFALNSEAQEAWRALLRPEPAPLGAAG